MRPEAENGEVEAAVRRCRACEASCEEQLSRLSARSSHDGLLPATIACVALLSMIGERLEAGLPCPVALLEHAIACAEALPADEVGCSDACLAAAEALSALVDASYERG
jgi:hypothetical protein